MRAGVAGLQAVLGQRWMSAGVLKAAGAPPVNVSPPVLDNLSAGVGETIYASPSKFTGATNPTTYQWYQAPSTPISGATSAAYTVQMSDSGLALLRKDTASNTFGSTTANSGQTLTIVSASPCFIKLDAMPLVGTTNRADVTWLDDSGHVNNPATETGHVPIWDATVNGVIGMALPTSTNDNAYLIMPSGVAVPSNNFTLVVITEKATARGVGSGGVVQDASYLLAGAVDGTVNIYGTQPGLLTSNHQGTTHGTIPIPTSLSLYFVSCDASTLTQRINELEETFTSANSSTSFASGNLLGIQGSFGQGPFQCRTRYVALYAAILSPTLKSNVIAFAQGLGVNLSPAYNIGFDGDSICTGALADPYLGWVQLLNLPSTYRQHNIAQSALTMAQCLAAAPSQLDNRVMAGPVINQCICTAGVNDLSQGATGAAIYANQVSYGAARKSAGWNKVAFYGVTPVATFDIQRQALRTLMLSDFTVATGRTNIWGARTGVTYADYYIDIAADATVGTEASLSNATYYVSGGPHPTNAGHAVLENYGAALVALMS